MESSSRRLKDYKQIRGILNHAWANKRITSYDIMNAYGKQTIDSATAKMLVNGIKGEQESRTARLVGNGLCRYLRSAKESEYLGINKERNLEEKESGREKMTGMEDWRKMGRVVVETDEAKEKKRRKNRTEMMLMKFNQIFDKDYSKIDSGMKSKINQNLSSSDSDKIKESHRSKSTQRRKGCHINNHFQKSGIQNPDKKKLNAQISKNEILNSEGVNSNIIQNIKIQKEVNKLEKDKVNREDSNLNLSKHSNINEYHKIKEESSKSILLPILNLSNKTQIEEFKNNDIKILLSKKDSAFLNSDKINEKRDKIKEKILNSLK